MAEEYVIKRQQDLLPEEIAPAIAGTDHNILANLQGGTSGEEYHLTQAQHTDLTDGNDSTSHYHATDRDRANHTGTQAISTLSDLNVFKTVAVSGQSDVVADSGTDTLTLAAGSNITITTDASTDTVTIAATAGSSLTVEESDGTPSVSDVDTIVFDGATVTDDTGGQVTITVTGGGGGGYDEGTSFPGSPSDGDKFYRTDLDLLCVYDGTNSRWLTVQHYWVENTSNQVLQNNSLAASTLVGYGVPPWVNEYDFWVEKLHWFYRISGTTSDGSNYFKPSVFYVTGTTLTTITNTDHDTVNPGTNFYSGRNFDVNFLAPKTADAYRFDMTKVGSPSGITAWGIRLTGRLVIT